MLVLCSCPRANLARSVLVLEEILKESREPGSLRGRGYQFQGHLCSVWGILYSCQHYWFGFCWLCLIAPANSVSDLHFLILAWAIIILYWYLPGPELLVCCAIDQAGLNYRCPCLYLTNGGTISQCHHEGWESVMFGQRRAAKRGVCNPWCALLKLLTLGEYPSGSLNLIWMEWAFFQLWGRGINPLHIV